MISKEKHSMKLYNIIFLISLRKKRHKDVAEGAFAKDPQYDFLNIKGYNSPFSFSNGLNRGNIFVHQESGEKVFESIFHKWDVIVDLFYQNLSLIMLHIVLLFVRIVHQNFHAVTYTFRVLR